MSDLTPQQVEAARAEAERASIGPRSSSLLVVMGGGVGFYEKGASTPLGEGVDVYFGVDWDADLERVVAAATDEEIDSGSQWGLYKTSREKLALALRVDWLNGAIEKSLYFDLDKWAVELGLVAQTGHLYLHPPEADGLDKLNGALGIDVDTDLVYPALAYYESIKETA